MFNGIKNIIVMFTKQKKEYPDFVLMSGEMSLSYGRDYETFRNNFEKMFHDVGEAVPIYSALLCEVGGIPLKWVVVANVKTFSSSYNVLRLSHFVPAN